MHPFPDLDDDLPHLRSLRLELLRGRQVGWDDVVGGLTSGCKGGNGRPSPAQENKSRQRPVAEESPHGRLDGRLGENQSVACRPRYSRYKLLRSDTPVADVHYTRR